jgi:hypothetical protein
MQFSSPTCVFLSLRYKYSPQYPIMKHPRRSPFLRGERPHLTPTQNFNLSLLRSFERICPDPTPRVTVRSVLVFFFTASRPTLKQGDHPLVGCPRLLIQYIGSYQRTMEQASVITGLC